MEKKGVAFIYVTSEVEKTKPLITSGVPNKYVIENVYINYNVKVIFQSYLQTFFLLLVFSSGLIIMSTKSTVENLTNYFMSVENVINMDTLRTSGVRLKEFESSREPKNHIKGNQQLLLRKYFAKVQLTIWKVSSLNTFEV